MAALTYPAIDPVLFSLGPFSVRWYGLAYVVGFLGAYLLFRWLNRRWQVGLSDDDILTGLLWCIVGALLGGRLGYVLFYGAGTYFSEPARIFAVWDGGMSWHGGFLGVVIVGVILARRFGVPFLRLADMAAVGAPIGFFFGRISNFVNNELWGRTTDVPWGMIPPGQTVARHPSQLYEALLEGLVIFVVLILLARTKRPPGFLFGMLMLMYGTFRFAVEYVREPDAQLGFIVGSFTMGQLLSVPLILLGGWLIYRALGEQRAG